MAARVVSEETAAYSSSSPSGSVKNTATSSVTTLSTSISRSAITPATSGGRFGTVTSKLCSANRPPGSCAVTVTVAFPFATPDTVTVLPDTETPTRAVSDDVAAYSSASRSGSTKYPDPSNATTLSTCTSRSAITPTASGARFRTVTRKLRSADSPSGSRAVTVTMALPTATPVAVTRLPETVTVTGVVSDAAAEYSSSSPSGSAKLDAASTTTTPSTYTSTSAITATTSGGRFGTVTSKLCSANRPPGSCAVTVTVAFPFATPDTVTVLPDTETATRVISDEAAAYCSVSLSGSSKYSATSTTTTLSTRTSRSVIAPTATGGRFGTVTP